MPVAIVLTLVGGALGVADATAEPRAAGSHLVTESFTGAVVADPKFIGLGSACLTGAEANSSAPDGASNLSDCDDYQVGPVPSQGSGASLAGWLQLTDASGGNMNNDNNGAGASASRAGGVLFNQALPASAGLHVEFDQAQYGGFVNSTQGAPEEEHRNWGADGISFFLTNGNFTLSQTGAPGGSLGYSQSQSRPGVAGAFLGIGLDAWGNFSRNYTGQGAGCEDRDLSPGNAGRLQDSIAVRGAGWRDGNDEWTQGYCLLEAKQLTSPDLTLREPWNSALGGSPDPVVRDAFAEQAQRRIVIEISPTNADGSATATVGFWVGESMIPVLTANVENVPATYKFGFASSTGNAGDVHLLRNLEISTINELTGLTLVKQEDLASPLYSAEGYKAGDQIPYVFTVTNTGQEPIQDLELVDDRADGIVCESLTLGPAGKANSSVTCTGTHTVTPEEATNSTEFTNTARAKGIADPSGDIESNDDSVTVPLIAPSPKLELKKNARLNDANGNGLGDVGETVTYTFEVTNRGNVTLAPVTITDEMLGLTGQECVSTLAPGVTASCATSGTYTITQDDLGKNLKNTAIATGTPITDAPGANASPAQDEASTTTSTSPPAPAPALDLKKHASLNDANGNGLGDVGETVTYTFEVTNTGNVTLAPVTITDEMLGLTGQECVSTLAPGVTASCATSGTYTITQDDLGKNLKNTAIATGTPITDAPGANASPAQDEASTTTSTSPPAPALDLKKHASLNDANGNGLGDVGETVTYTFEVTNTGNVTLAPVTITDEMLGLTGQECVSTLAPGDTAPCATSGTYTITQDDLGKNLVNTAIATGTPGTDTPETGTPGANASPAQDEASTTTSTSPPAPALDLKKHASLNDANGNGLGDVGETVTYTFEVTNTGNVTLAPVTITDEMLGLTGQECVSTLAPGDTAPCATSGTYTITQDDLGKNLVNTAIAAGTPEAGTPGANAGPAVDSDTVETPVRAPAPPTGSPDDGIGPVVHTGGMAADRSSSSPTSLALLAAGVTLALAGVTIARHRRGLPKRRADEFTHIDRGSRR
ncbi:DUF7507 domain-containing protein [Xylanimonas allomyrinae]|uniref:DUF7507 domain-containing protein n=1 Tax=Xylanimonas allomyrinae TaxID=2509459 RepID=UPI0013A67117|nr:hypothetical protein [Xylanimonas allomyrinae]